MNTLNRISRTLVSSAALAGCLIVTAQAQSNDLVGTWECKMSVDDAQTGVSVNFDFEMTYDSDGSYERAGEMNMKMAAMQVDATIELNESGTWSLDGLSLTETRSEIQFSSTNEEPSQAEQMILQGMQSAAAATSEETIELTSLTADTLEFEQDGGVVCSKS